MVSPSRYYPLPFEVVSLMRRADLFTGDLPSAVP